VKPPALAPLDPRRRAFATAVGKLLAELVWREATALPAPHPRALEREVGASGP